MPARRLARQAASKCGHSTPGPHPAPRTALHPSPCPDPPRPAPHTHRAHADHGSAAVALAAVNKAVLFGQEMRVNWAFQKELKAEAAAHVHVFVGDLSSDITDAMLFQV